MRYFFIAAANQHPFTGYRAHALGIQSKYETGSWKHFKLAAGGSAVYNLASSKLLNNDTLAKRPNRYEVGWFDRHDPNGTKVLAMSMPL